MEMKDKKTEGFRDENKEGLEALSKSLRISFVWIYVLIAVMGVIMAAQSFVIVKQHEKAVIYRFGNLRKIVGNGLHLTFPYPVERVEVFEVTRSKQIESSSFMFAPGKDGEAVPPVLKPMIDGYVISTDINIIHMRAVLNYSVNPENQDSLMNYFVFNVDSAKLLKELVDNSMIKAAAGLKSDEILFNPEKLRSKMASELRKNLEKSGISISFEARDISLSTSPPRQTKTAFDALSQANQNQETAVNDAESYKIKTGREAQSSRDSLVAEAESARQRKISSAQADAETFSHRIVQFNKNPDMVARTIYEDSIFRILKAGDEKFIIDASDNRQIRLLLGRNLEKKQEKKNKNEGK